VGEILPRKKNQQKLTDWTSPSDKKNKDNGGGKKLVEKGEKKNSFLGGKNPQKRDAPNKVIGEGKLRPRERPW